jgi:glutaredoxin-related protein
VAALGEPDRPGGVYSVAAIRTLLIAGADFDVVHVRRGSQLDAQLTRRSGVTFYPKVFVDDEYIGGGEVLGPLLWGQTVSG